MAIGQGPGDILAAIAIDSTTDTANAGAFNCSRVVLTPTAEYTITLNTASTSSFDNVHPIATVETAAGAGFLAAFVVGTALGVYKVAIVDETGALKSGSGARLHVSFFRAAV